MTAAVVFGGYGTFGSLVSRELARMGIAVAVAGRDLGKAEALASALGPPHLAFHADARDPRSCRDALQGRQAAVLCAGPFAPMGEALLAACLEAGCHYADIAEDREYAGRVRAWGPRFEARGLTAAYGCSSLPGLSGALALAAAADRTPSRTPASTQDLPRSARVTLFIGSNNPKGDAAIRSMVGGLGRSINAPQGTLVGFAEGAWADLPPPFGRRRVHPIASPEYDLFPALLGVGEVVVSVGFELPLANPLFSFLARFRPGDFTASVIARLAALAPRLGTSGGAVMAELVWHDGSTRRAAAVARRDGQRMAALPCALAVHALLTGARKTVGAATAYEVLGWRALLDAVAAAGFEVTVG